MENIGNQECGLHRLITISICWNKHCLVMPTPPCKWITETHSKHILCKPGKIMYKFLGFGLCKVVMSHVIDLELTESFSLLLTFHSTKSFWQFLPMTKSIGTVLVGSESMVRKPTTDCTSEVMRYALVRNITIPSCLVAGVWHAGWFKYVLLISLNKHPSLHGGQRVCT